MQVICELMPSAAQLIGEYPWRALRARRLLELPDASSSMPRRASSWVEATDMSQAEAASARQALLTLVPSAAQLMGEYPWLALGARRLLELPKATSTMTGPGRVLSSAKAVSLA